MPSTYTDILRLELQADGENDGTWGQILNDNVIALVEDAIAGTADVSTTGGTTALSTNDGAEDQARKRAINVTGSLASDAIIEVPAQTKPYRVINGTSGSFTVEVLVSGQSAGNGVVVPQGARQEVWCDGTNVEPTSLPLDDSGVAQNFASTGIDDNASSTTITIDSSRNVGIGTSSPEAQLHATAKILVKTKNSSGVFPVVEYGNFDADPVSFRTGVSDTGNLIIQKLSNGSFDENVWEYSENLEHIFYANSSERARIDSDGHLLVDTTNASAAANGVNGISLRRGGVGHFSSSVNPLNVGRNTSTGSLVTWYNQGSQLSTVFTDGSTVSYNTGSDRRLKKNDRPIEDAVERIRNTNWVAFEFIKTGHYGEGVIAQDEAERWRTAGTYDEEADQWNWDYSKMVPALGAALSGALERIEALEAKSTRRST
jgi:hypothetical protein